MKLFCFDAETFLIRKGNAAPKIVCVSTCYDGEVPKLFHARFDREALAAEFKKAFEDPDVLIVNVNIAFDWFVLAKWCPEDWVKTLNLYQNDRVSELMIRQRLIRLAYGRFYDGSTDSLAEMASQYLGMEMDKKNPNGPRTRYSEVEHLPIHEWPEVFRDYALEDAMLPIEIWKEQAIYAAKHPEKLERPLVDPATCLINDEFNETRSALVARGCEAWGFRTDKEAIDHILPKLSDMVDERMQTLIMADPSNPSCTSMMDPECIDLAVKEFRQFWEKKETHALASGDPDDKPRKTVANPDQSWIVYYENKLAGAYRDNVPATTKTLKSGKIKTVPAKIYNDKAIYRPQTGKAGLEGELRCNTFVLHAIICKAYDGVPPLSDTGMVSASAKKLEHCRDEIVNQYTSFQSEKTEVTSTIPKLYMGVDHPLPTRFTSLIATGRWSSAAINLQNFTSLTGVRECIIPRPGTVFINADFDSLEIRTWAHVCEQLVGFSTAAQKYRADRNWDPHSEMGAAIGHKTYEDFFANKGKIEQYKVWRTMGKPITFGVPGGMGLETIITTAKGYGVILDMEEATHLRNIWRNLYPEWKQYFGIISSITKTPNRVCVQVGSGRQRGDCGYCDLANSYFQGLAADLVKRVGWQIFYETFDKSSPLYRSRLINVVHDEYILEAPLHCYREAAIRLREIMITVGEEVVDVPIEAEVLAMDRWSKSAYPIYNERGELEICKIPRLTTKAQGLIL